eukprot:TRINITY_DN7455_c0_g1_i10.p4 TRINITY_DN7455_c0_g1~~TRINITY_DN7455_c0_g1_i10.p4  ORF type:complete len:151 (+),score=35.21 TRINITY_DN7455_c0_g1_i10:43-453(+)
MYFKDEINDLPKQIIYKKDGYIYNYVLIECPPPMFNGIELMDMDFEITGKDGHEFSTKKYSYELYYTDEPKGPEVAIGIVSVLPEKAKFPVKGKAVPKESLKIPEIEKIKLEKGNVKIEDINKLSKDKIKKKQFSQ